MPTGEVGRQGARWAALLIGGSSGVGKTAVAREIRRRVGVDYLLAVDDLRLAFQHSRVTLPDDAGTRALYVFWDAADVWRRSPEELRDALIAAGQAMAPAVEVVVMNHADQGGSIVIEGDNIVPSLFARPLMRDRARGDRVRGVFLVERDEGTLLANIVARGRAMAGQTEAERRTEARAKWLYGLWLADEARRHGLPVLDARPWATLADRILDAAAR